MKLLISVVAMTVLVILPLVPVTTTISYTTKMPEEYTITETYTEYVPRVGERAVWNENPEHTQWRTSIKTSIEDARPPAGRSGYFSIEYFTYSKAVTRDREVTKIRLVDKIISTNATEHISVAEYMFK